MSVGERLRRAREKKNWSTRRLERETVRLGRRISHGYISQIENERYKANPSLSTLDVLARALDIPLSWLLEDHSAAESPENATQHDMPLVLARAAKVLGIVPAKSNDVLTAIAQRTALTVDAINSLTDEEPDLALIQRLANSLNTTMHYLLGRIDDPAPLPGVAVAHHDPEKGVDIAEPLPPQTQLIVERAILEAKREWGWNKQPD